MTVGILRHFLTVALVDLQYMVVVFPVHTLLFFFLSRDNLNARNYDTARCQPCTAG